MIGVTYRYGAAGKGKGMRRLAMGLALLAGPAIAQQWQPLDGAGITAALSGRVVVYADGARQDFKPDGQTIYTKGRDSLGHWALRGDLYCSVWPPSDIWACYAVAVQGTAVKFIAADGSETQGAIAP
ncbi:hypothetical protein [Cypionkella sp. TWP1-2-1b2]|uniref:hypothetical protein n=1 Tax=Cypionkella sp. TWP1-2-1b2 TaxID=2804675 RepID=UPI003CE8E31B